MGIDAAIAIIFGLLDRAQAYSALVNKARAEGRDITEQELDTLAAGDDAAADLLKLAVAKRKAEGG